MSCVSSENPNGFNGMQNELQMACKNEAGFEYEEPGTFINSIRAKEQSPWHSRMPRVQEGQMGSRDWQGNNK